MSNDDKSDLLADAPRLFGRVVVVHAHPDDETLATGITLAALASAGAQVTLVTCTRGESGEVIPVEIAHLEGDRLALAAHREGELSRALDALGVTDHYWLGAAGARQPGFAPRRYTDSGMAWGPDGPELPAEIAPDALCAADPGEVAADLASVMLRVNASAVISYDANGGYGHPDHIAATEAARRAAAVLELPFYEIASASPDSRGHDSTPSAVTVTATADSRQRVRAALQAHASQLVLDGDTITLSGGQQHRVPDEESLRFVSATAGRFSRWGIPAQRPSLAESWARGPLRVRVAWYAAGAVGGVIVGALGTVAFSTTSTIGDVVVPWGLIAALVVVTALLVGLRMAFATRVVAGSFGLALLATVNILALESVGGSVLIPLVPPENFAYYWVYGPLVIAFVVLAWPRIVRPPQDRITAAPAPAPAPAAAPSLEQSHQPKGPLAP